MIVLGVGIASQVYYFEFPYYTKLTSAWLFTSVGFNMIVTGLIGAHLMAANRQLRKALPTRSVQVYTGVAAMLVETALPPAFFGIISAILSEIVVPLTTPANFELERATAMVTLTFTLTALYLELAVRLVWFFLCS